MDDNPSCQHLRINRMTGCCVTCDEQMITVSHEAQTVLSAPNAVGCANPACLAAIAAGTYDDAPPPDCTNRHGVYVPDTSREREIVIGWKVTYTCVRCAANAQTTTYSGRTVIWPCGGVHRGDPLSVKAAT